VNEDACRYSWPTYLATTHRYGDWVDRGALGPRHAQWADYLRWAAERAGLVPRPVAVTGLGLAGGRWQLATADGGRVRADGVLITGPGPSRQLPGQVAASRRVLDGRSVWPAIPLLARDPPRTVAVVGAGETTGAIAAALGARLPASLIEVVTRDGVLHSRGESHTENALYTDPSGWRDLPERMRLTLLATTDRGVFSQAAQASLDALDNVRTVAGRVRSLDDRPDGVTLLVDDGVDEEPVPVLYEVVVVATGFDPLWWRVLDDGTVEPALRRALGGRTLTQRAVERVVGHDLTITGLDPPLHVPMLAGLTQGPGFPTCPAWACSPTASWAAGAQ
jgi:mycobactin lysine-N-oxygenase